MKHRKRQVVLLPFTPVNATTAAAVIDQVCEAYRVTALQVVGVQRSQRIMTARHVCMYWIRKITNLSYPRIGMMFGRDHTTILHAVQKIEAAMVGK